MRRALLLLTFSSALVAQDTPELRQALALSKAAAALDTSHRAAEAELIHKKAIALAPHSADILNNYATHLWLNNEQLGALAVYRQVLAIDPSQPTANVLLAQAALANNKPAEALVYIGHLPDGMPQKPLLRTEALYKSGNTAQAEAAAARLLELSRGDPLMAAAAGTVLTTAGQLEHAREAFTIGLSQQPRNIDLLYSLAAVDEALKQPEAAAQLLARAAKLDPQRADIQKLLAITTSELNAWDDAAAAWDRYLKLVPTDDTAQRERDYTDVIRGDAATGIAGLERYTARHPNDVVGQYELGLAAKSIAHLDRAIELDPKYEPALTARGSLLYQEGNAEAALRDFEAAAALRPGDAVNLDRLGQTYQSLDRAAEAVTVLRKAAQLAPGDAKTQLHLGRALADAGDMAASKAAMERFRQLSTERRPGIPSGLVDYLAMTPAERRASNRGRIEKAVREHPEDPQAQLSALEQQLRDNKQQTEVAQTVKRLTALKPNAEILAQAGRALLNASEYALAEQVLAQSKNVGLELAIANFYAGSGSGALVEQAISAAAPTEQNRLTATSFLLRNNKPIEALALVEQAARAFPNNRDILLQRALALEAAGHFEEADGQLDQVQNRWPEWAEAWRLHSGILKAHNRPDDAKKAADTAAALGLP